MVYIRGHAYDYDRWKQEGAKGWSYADCLPYFRKSQTHELGEVLPSSEIRKCFKLKATFSPGALYVGFQCGLMTKWKAWCSILIFANEK